MTKTPFLYLVISLSAGLICGYFTDVLPLGILLLFFFLVAFISVVFISDIRPAVMDIICIVLVSIFGFLYYEGRTRIYPKNHIRHLNGIERELTIIGDILSLPDTREEKTYVEVEARSLVLPSDTIPVCGRIRVSLGGDVEYGERLILYGRLDPPPPARNPGGFDYREWLARQNIYNTMSPDSVIKVGENFGNRFILLAAGIRSYIETTIDRNIGGDKGAFLKGITIGERGMISEEVQEVFRNTGVVHILAVSGLHVGILAAMLFLVIRLFRLPNLVNIIITSACLIVYAFMIDLRPSVVRATIMSIFLMITLLTERDTDILNTLCVTAFAILIWNPQFLFDVSFQLSFGATAGIIYLYPKVHSLIKMRNRNIDNAIIKPFTISLSAQAGTTLLAAHYFYRLPVISLIANIFVVPLTGLCIGTGLLLSLVNLLKIDVLSRVFASAVYGVTALTLGTVNLFGKVPYGHFWIGSPSPLFLIFYFILLVSGVNALYYMIKRRVFNPSHKIFVYTVIVSLILLVSSRLYRVNNREVRVTFMEVGMGNSTLVEIEDDVILMDGGSYYRDIPVSADLLRRNGTRDVSLVFLTSPLSYDIGGLTYILENFNVKGVALPFIPYHTYAYKRFLHTIKEKKIPYRFVAKGDRIGPFTVKNPMDEIPLDIKDASLVLTLNVGQGLSLAKQDYKILFLGEVKSNIMEMAEEADIMKAPYFGDYRDPSFIEIVKPKVTVVSVGKNRWAMPSQEMMEEYKKYGRVIRTDEDGACLVRISKDAVTIQTMRDREKLGDKLLRWVGVR
ncbi:MAG: DNA internalization-related competence protein ComEC/Rec2 [bacterium]|nr:DNA internalization-related competence protein ComEC/Rec2 [bacterium]